MAAIFQTTFSDAFSWMKIHELRLIFHRALFLRDQLTIFQYWFRYWLGAGQATSHYLNQWWLVCRRIYASLGLNELITYHLTILFLLIRSKDFFYFYGIWLYKVFSIWKCYYRVIKSLYVIPTRYANQKIGHIQILINRLAQTEMGITLLFTIKPDCLTVYPLVTMGLL